MTPIIKPYPMFFFTDYEHFNRGLRAKSQRSALLQFKEKYGIETKVSLINHIKVGNREQWEYMSRETGYKFVILQIEGH